MGGANRIIWKNSLLPQLIAISLLVIPHTAWAHDIQTGPRLPPESTSCAPLNKAAAESAPLPELEVISPKGRLLFRDAHGNLYAPQGLRLFDTFRSQSKLMKLLKGRTYRLLASGDPNRWQIAPAWITEAPSGTLQELLLKEGLALADPVRAEAGCADILRHWETNGRKARHGLWEEEFPLAARLPDPILAHVSRYVVVEGTLLSLGKTDRTSYLNFGANWDMDFTATISAKNRPGFEETLARLERLTKGSTKPVVRLRGTVEVWDGPTIRLSHPGQVEIVSDE